MDECVHKNLVLMNQDKNKLRCIHCHLTINEEELETDFCPECWETDRIKRSDFEKVEQKYTDTCTYRCEGCGVEVKIA
jgi:Zn finger protein HypA/HybF involved in hydrogenase expression